MKKTLLIAFFFATGFLYGQEIDQIVLNLNNAVVIGQMDTPADRYSVEVNLTRPVTVLNLAITVANLVASISLV